jgi:ribosome-binding protein aMBF1 (putative translation factor)
MTPTQSKAARGALGWDRRVTAERSKLNDETIRRFEHGAGVNRSTLELLERTFIEAGIEFVGKNGISWKE